MSQFISGDLEVDDAGPSMDRVRVQYEITFETIMRGVRAIEALRVTPILLAGRWTLRILCLLWLVMGLYFLAFPPPDRGPGTASPGPIMAGMGGAGLAIPSLRRRLRIWSIRRGLSRRAEKDRWIAWTITPDDVEVRDYLSTVRLKWGGFSEAIERRDGFLFLLRKDQGYFLPASAFTWENEARFVSDWARRRVAKYRKMQDIEVEDETLGPSFNAEL